MLRQPGMWGQWASPMHAPFGHAPYAGSWPQRCLVWRVNLSLEDDLGFFSASHRRSFAFVYPQQEFSGKMCCVFFKYALAAHCLACRIMPACAVRG